MSVDNKEQFNLLTGKILALLVNACPVPVQITAETFGLPKGEYKAERGGPLLMGFYDNTPEEEVLKSLLKWLEAENYVREKGGYYVATLQTLKLYNSVPNAISE
ncbi:hypothetical protein LOY67_17555 [Pseudomonas sp. B21-056]|uniref:hypothetical protein n=1 Tax=Pseudomonas sp. B21-056 TaxID=2895495 RepID=UPI002232527A|nr:hypothetical protein [Pseudomonas sp. B21-056]UZE21853.1 hypothetical protein LOY67_17555 [Pseudomonas sp. B21-056]